MSSLRTITATLLFVPCGFKTVESAVRGGMRGCCCLLSDARAISTDKAARLATIANHCQLRCQIFMSLCSPPHPQKDVRPSAENTGYHQSLAVIAHTSSRCGMNKHWPFSCPSVPQSSSVCQKSCE